jgi:hypothetical protein
MGVERKAAPHQQSAQTIVLARYPGMPIQDIDDVDFGSWPKTLTLTA